MRNFRIDLDKLMEEIDNINKNEHVDVKLIKNITANEPTLIT